MNDQVENTINDQNMSLTAIWLSTAAMAAACGVTIRECMETQQRLAWADKFEQLVAEHLNTVDDELKKLSKDNDFGYELIVIPRVS